MNVDFNENRLNAYPRIHGIIDFISNKNKLNHNLRIIKIKQNCAVLLNLQH